MKILTSNQTLLVKLLTVVTLCSLFLSVVPVGVFNARAEEVPVVSETTPIVDPVVEPVIDLPIPPEEPTTTDEPMSTPPPELPLVSRIMSALPPKSTETIIVKGNTSAGENLPGWLFNRDITTATPFVFSTDQAVIGLGSLEVLPIGSNPSDKFVGEYFVLDTIANVLSYTYDFKIGAGGDATDEEQFYLNVYANYGESSPTKFYDCRYNVVPTVGSTGGFTTVTFDPTQAYPVATRGGASASPYTCPAIPADMNLQSPGSTFRAFTINLGDTSTSDIGIDGYFDKVVLDTTAKTTTFDFEPVTVKSCEAFASVVTTNLSTWDLSQTRANGHNQLVDGGLRIYTDTDVTGSPDPRKAAGYYTTNFPLSDLGAQTIDQALTYTPTTGIEPGLQLVTDFDNNGSPDGILVGEAVYGNAWWLSNSASQFVKDNAPNTGGGYGSNWYGTPNDWLTKFPNAKVIAIGYSLGSGVNGDGVISEINLGCTKYTFDVPAPIKVHILKYLTDEDSESPAGITQIPDDSTAPSFPMTATWNAENIGGGTGNYVLGNGHGGSAFKYGADTAAMSVPADYTTSEITGGDSPVLPIGAECTPGKYRLVGYKDGDTTEQAEEAEMTDTAPVYTDLDSDRTIIVVNESCDDIVVTPDPVCVIGENLLQNGSFETSTVTDHSGQWEIFSTVANWVISLSDGLELWKNFNGTGAGLASDGIQNAELDGNDATKISQTVTTVPGATYELTFDFSPRAGVAAANNKLDALVGGSPVLSLMADGSTTTANTWRPQTYSFVATSTSTTIAFEDKGIADENGGYGPLLDNAALCVTQLPKPTGTVTMCKVDEMDVPQSGWTLTLLGDKVEDVVVPTNTSTGINTVATLDNGKPYVALTTGTWNNQGGANPVDTEYSTTDAWATHMDGYTGYSTDILELQINSAFDPNSNWGAYNNAHAYAQGFMQAATATANFRIFDGTGTAVNEGWYGDNSGTLNVSLYKGYAGVTGENGCVTFTDVPFGTYTAGEIMQDGWEGVSGTGSVNTAYPSSQFTIVNQIIDGDEEPVPARTHLVSGVKWNDADGDGDKDEEPNLGGWTITAQAGDISTTTTTNESGAYHFNLPVGPWTISEVTQENWQQTGLYQNGDKITLGGETSNNCSFVITTDAEATYTCDFGNQEDEEIGVPEPTEPTSGRSSSGSKSKKKPTPQVLGAATSAPQCGIYLNDYMRKGNAASSTQVTKLQIFLNAVEIKLPVTGIFDDATDEAVRAFQLKHKAEVLTPWYTAGIVPHDNPTGWVYQLTRWKINNIVCPGSEAYPTLN